jgi:hypothetical protein
MIQISSADNVRRAPYPRLSLYLCCGFDCGCVAARHNCPSCRVVSRPRGHAARGDGHAVLLVGWDHRDIDLCFLCYLCNLCPDLCCLCCLGCPDSRHVRSVIAVGAVAAVAAVAWTGNWDACSSRRCGYRGRGRGCGRGCIVSVGTAAVCCTPCCCGDPPNSNIRQLMAKRCKLRSHSTTGRTSTDWIDLR